MKAIETQIKLKKLQGENDRQLGSDDLDAALEILGSRRRLIQAAILKQRTRNSERQRLALKFLEQKSKNDRERQRLAQELRKDRLEKIRSQKQKRINAALKLQQEAVQEAQRISAHKNLIDASNKRITQKLPYGHLAKNQYTANETY